MRSPSGVIRCTLFGSCLGKRFNCRPVCFNHPPTISAGQSVFFSFPKSVKGFEKDWDVSLITHAMARDDTGAHYRYNEIPFQWTGLSTHIAGSKMFHSGAGLSANISPDQFIFPESMQRWTALP